MKICDLSAEDRPREKLARLGAGALTDAELVALLLRTGYKGKDVLELAEELTHAGRLYKELVYFQSVAELQQIKGLGGLSKSTLLLAVMELGRRIARHSSFGDGAVVLTEPADVYALLAPELRYENQEKFYVLLLNNRNRLLRYVEVSSGTLTETTVHQRNIFRPAIVYNAAKIMLVHNHPSGDPSPSRQDRNMTRVLQEAGEIMGIPVIDHVIIGGSDYFSFSDNGML